MSFVSLCQPKMVYCCGRQGISLRGDRATEKVSICACLLCAFPALRFAKCSLTVRPVQFRSHLAKIITTSKRKCARSCGVGDAVQGGGRCPKQYLSVLQGCISAHCANIQPHNLAFSVARSPTCAHSLHFGHCSLIANQIVPFTSPNFLWHSD